MTPSERGRAQFNARSFDEARQRGLRKSLETRLNAPRCGARRRTDGEPCMQPVKEDGKRCRYHGGATPKGREWHRRQWPKKGAAPSRLAGKMKALQLRDRQAAKHRAAMTPEEREQHEARRRIAKPGTPVERGQAAANRKAAKWLAERLGGPQSAAPGAQAPIAAEKSPADRPKTPSALGRVEGSSTGGIVASAEHRRGPSKRPAHAEKATPATGVAAPSASRAGPEEGAETFRRSAAPEGAEAGRVPIHNMSAAELSRLIDHCGRAIDRGLAGGFQAGEEPGRDQGGDDPRPSIFD